MSNTDTVNVALTSSQALCLIKLISARLEFLASQSVLSNQEQIEYQALRNIALQLRDGAQERIK